MPKRFKPRRRKYRTRFAKRVGKIARKIAQKEDKKLHARKSYNEHGFGGVCGSLAGAPAVPAPNRMIAFGRVDYLNSQRMWNALNTCSGIASPAAIQEMKVWLEGYSEKWTIQNACLFPVVLKVYKVKFKEDYIYNYTNTTQLYNAYGTAATEAGLYGLNTQTVDNYVSVPSAFGGYSSFLQCLWKDLLYSGKKQNQIASPGDDPYISHISDTTYGKTYTAVGCIDRKFGLIEMGLKETRRLFDIKKIKTTTLTPGMQTSVLLKKGRRLLPGDYFQSSNATDKNPQQTCVKRGAEQFVFVAYGLMSHDSAATNINNINSVARSSFDLNFEINRNYRFRYTDMQQTQAENDVFNYARGDAIGTEVRPGVQVEETAII